ncbi:unnamed protein product [Amoebophrya sp. A120]|nr:unnamed protein product [Amoebophrya sp. A120]|eukprot:GSA120T00004896001.1
MEQTPKQAAAPSEHENALAEENARLRRLAQKLQEERDFFVEKYTSYENERQFLLEEVSRVRGDVLSRYRSEQSSSPAGTPVAQPFLFAEAEPATGGPTSSENEEISPEGDEPDEHMEAYRDAGSHNFRASGIEEGVQGDVRGDFLRTYESALRNLPSNKRLLAEHWDVQNNNEPTSRASAAQNLFVGEEELQLQKPVALPRSSLFAEQDQEGLQNVEEEDSVENDVLSQQDGVETDEQRHASSSDSQRVASRKSSSQTGSGDEGKGNEAGAGETPFVPEEQAPDTSDRKPGQSTSEGLSSRILKESRRNKNASAQKLSQRSLMEVPAKFRTGLAFRVPTCRGIDATKAASSGAVEMTRRASSSLVAQTLQLVAEDKAFLPFSTKKMLARDFRTDLAQKQDSLPAAMLHDRRDLVAKMGENLDNVIPWKQATWEDKLKTATADQFVSNSKKLRSLMHEREVQAMGSDTSTNQCPWPLAEQAACLQQQNADVCLANSELPYGPLRHAATFEGVHTSLVSRCVEHPKLPFVGTVSDDNTWKITAIESGEVVLTGAGHKGWVTDLAFHRWGNVVVTTGVDHCVKLWSLQEGRCVHTFVPENCRNLWACAAHDFSDFFAVAGDDGVARVYDMVTRKLRQSMRGHVGAITSLVFENFGNLLTTSSNDKTASFWDMRSGICVKTLQGHVAPLNAVSYAPDNHYVVTADEGGNCRIWDVRMARETLRIDCGHTAAHVARFDCSGKSVAIGSGDGTVLLFDVERQCFLQSCDKGDPCSVNDLFWSRGNQNLVTVTANGSVVTWKSSARK